MEVKQYYLQQYIADGKLDMKLTDQTITLRPFNVLDAKKHLEGEDSQQIKWVSGGKGTIEGIENWIKKNELSWKNNGPIFNFAIINPTNELSGFVEANTDFENVDGLSKGDANISYGLYPNYRGKGYATAAVNLILKFLKEKGLRRAIIRVNPENEGSLKIPQRLGFEKSEEILTNKGDKLVVFLKNLNF